MAIERLKHLEATGDLEGVVTGVRVLSNRLLYGMPTIDEEVAGYSAIRHFAGHSDRRISTIAGEQIEARWSKVPVYYQRKASDHGYPRVERDSFDPAHLDAREKIALVELAKAAGMGERLTLGRFDERLFPILGPGTDTPSIIDDLKKKYILDPQGEYSPVLNTQRGRLNMTEEATRVLFPSDP